MNRTMMHGSTNIFTICV